jgi:outer membrane protein OmpA-like peptidoglycan-associated protein
MYLSRLGVDGSRLVATSRGKLDASGTSEDGWRLDRRVDIEVSRGGGTNAKQGG